MFAVERGVIASARVSNSGDAATIKANAHTRNKEQSGIELNAIVVFLL